MTTPSPGRIARRSVSTIVTDTSVVVRTPGRVSFLRPEEIEWLDAAGNSVKIYAGGAVHKIRETMHGIEQQLDPARFARIHRSTIVNLARVRELLISEHGDYTVVTDGGRRLTVGRLYRERVQARNADEEVATGTQRGDELAHRVERTGEMLEHMVGEHEIELRLRGNAAKACVPDERGVVRWLEPEGVPPAILKRVEPGPGPAAEVEDA